LESVKYFTFANLLEILEFYVEVEEPRTLTEPLSTTKKNRLPELSKHRRNPKKPS